MLSILYCKPKEEVPFKRTFIPDKMFGIDFCNLQLIHIVRELQSKQVIFRCYDDETNEEIECNEKNVQRKIINIETEYFIGLKFFNKNIHWCPIDFRKLGAVGFRSRVRTVLFS